jgi:D-alanyl-D-alanine carboxypeptidase (penicillin-binding protein 5/6)
LRQFPEALKYHSMREYTYNGITQHNRNRLLFKDDSVDGLKTGFIAASGYHLAATAKRDGMRLVAVVMGTPKPAVRERESLKLLNYGFRRYAMVNPFQVDQPATTVKVWKGQKDHLELYPEENSNVLIEQSARNSVRWIVDAPKEITAPVQAHRPVGSVTLYVGENLKKTIALASHEDVAQAGLITRLWHSLLRIHTLNWRLIGMVTLGIILLLVLGVLAARQFNRFRLQNQRRSKHY